jgi:hypothetical protein
MALQRAKHAQRGSYIGEHRTQEVSLDGVDAALPAIESRPPFVSLRRAERKFPCICSNDGAGAGGENTAGIYTSQKEAEEG